MSQGTKFVQFIEIAARSLAVKIFIYVMAGLFVFIYGSILVSPAGATTDYWLNVARRAGRDAVVLAGFVYVQRYCATYTARRASLTLRRRDAAAICILLLTFAALDTAWPHGILFALPFGALIYFWELRNIHRDERDFGASKT